MAPPRGVDQLAKLFDGAVAIRDPLPPRRKKNAGKVDADDDCVILDGDPRSPVAVAVAIANGRSASDDEVEIFAVRGEIACKDFPHSRHVCSEFPFSTTSHRKHCSMCYCFACDAPAPCKYWGEGQSNNKDHCHATDKEAKWKTLRQAFKCKSLPTFYSEKQVNVVHPTTSPPRQQEHYQEHTPEEYRVEGGQQDYYEEYTSEEYRLENEEDYFDPDEEATVCVENLPYDIDSEYLGQLFKYAGNVVSSEIIYDTETGQSCGYGYVTMSTVWEAENVVENYNLRELYGRIVTVSKAAVTSGSGARAEETPSPRQQDYYEEYTSEEYRVEDGQQDYSEEYTPEEYRAADEEEYCDPDEEATLCVGNLPYDIDSEYLGQLFEYAGSVMSSEIIYDTETGESCGYGYVTMSTAWEAENAVKDYHLRELYGRLVTVSKAAVAASGSGAEEETPYPPVSSSFKLYVCNLPWEADGSELKQLFSGYGEVVHAKVLYNGRGSQRRSRGFGFVTMATQEGSEAAIWDLDKQVWRGRKLRVRVASEEGSQ